MTHLVALARRGLGKLLEVITRPGDEVKARRRARHKSLETVRQNVNSGMWTSNTIRRARMLGAKGKGVLWYIDEPGMPERILHAVVRARVFKSYSITEKNSGTGVL